MTPEEMAQRTKQFALRVVRLSGTLPRDGAAGVIRGQLVRCATSVGANYRAARRARSGAEFRAKLGIVEEEADESVYWLEVLMETNLVARDRIEDLHREAVEILKITVSMLRTAKSNAPNRPSRRAR